MVRRFSDDSSGGAKSLKLYLILVGHATHAETTTYKALGEKIGAIPRKVGYYLDPVAKYCRSQRLPWLTSLVVNKDTGKPGGGYLGPTDSITQDRESVFSYDWLDIVPPTVDDLTTYF